MFRGLSGVESGEANNLPVGMIIIITIPRSPLVFFTMLIQCPLGAKASKQLESELRIGDRRRLD